MHDAKARRHAATADHDDRAPAAAAAGTAGKGSGTDGLEAASSPAPARGGVAGGALPWNLRTLFEKSLGRDLGDVRIHDDADAAARAEAHGARAFATGQDIAFNRGEYAPESPEGRRLIAHEVAHTVQQRGAATVEKPATTQPGDGSERNADAAADAMLAGQPAEIAPQAQQSIARKAKDEETEKKPLPSNPLDLVKVTDGKLAKTGTVTTKLDKETLELNGPDVRMTGSAMLTKAAVEADEDVGTVEVGPIQNVTSKRFAIYRKPGTNEIVARYNSTVNNLLDQRPDGNDVNKAWAKPPWYQPPATLSRDQTVNAVTFKDQPGFDLPIKNGGGVLSEVQGADNFVTSVAMRRNGGAVTHISSQQWSIPWDMKIDPTTHLGDIGKKNETVFTDNNKVVPTVLDGPIATNSPDYYSFPTVAAARAAGVDVLLGPRGLSGARGRDPESYMNMWHAIRGLNPAWCISVKCVDQQEIWSDPVQVTMKGHGGQAKVESFKVSEGQVKYAYVRFLELFDPDTWSHGDALRFTIQGSKHTFKEVNVLRPENDGFQQVTSATGAKNAAYEYAVTRTDNG